MSQSVSFILPVGELQFNLRDRVHLILDVLAELTDSFDLVIVDYGPHDATCELTMELVREFPQVEYLHRGEGADFLAAVEAGIDRSRGEIIFVHDPSIPLGLTALHNLWQMRNDADLVMAQSRATDAPEVPAVTVAASRRTTFAAARSLQMIRRCAIPLPAVAADRPYSLDKTIRTDPLNDPSESRRLPKLLTRLRHVAKH